MTPISLVKNRKDFVSKTQGSSLRTTFSERSYGVPTDGIVLRITFGLFLLRKKLGIACKRTGWQGVS